MIDRDRDIIHTYGRGSFKPIPVYSGHYYTVRAIVTLSPQPACSKSVSNVVLVILKQENAFCVG